MTVRALLFALFFALTPVPAIAQAAEEPVWAFEDSDLPVDPDYRFGRLDNGLRYIVRPNATPAGQGMVWMWFHGGSLFENEDERGYAHFVEHMAFNGSTNVPEGEMVRLLEREGLAFGADTNASTGFDQTIYKLNLPRNDPVLLDTALMLMRETASELTFDPEAVEREKGVVLSERRVGDTYAYRNTVDNFEFLFPGARLPARLPIGTAETLQAASAERLREVWRRIYRPQNAALIVVGEFDPAVVETMIRQHFADWQGPPAPPQPDPGPFDFSRAGETDIHLDPALPERVTISAVGPALDERDSMETRKVRLMRQVGYAIVNRRLQRLTRLDDPPFRGAGLGDSGVLEAAHVTNLVVDAADGEWRRALAAAQAEYRKALEFGFTVNEVAEQLASIRTAIENAAAGAHTRPNSTFVNAALLLLNEGQVPTTQESQLARYEAFEAEITPDTALAALKDELVPLDDPLIRFQGRVAPDGGAEGLRAAWNEGMAEEIAPDEALDVPDFAYDDFGPPGTIVSDTVEPVLGIRTLRFANGVRLNLKPTELERDRIAIELNVDGGQLLNTRENPLATAMTAVLPVGGLGRHTTDELQTILAGRSVGFSVAAEDDSFRLGATTTPRDLELQLQLMAAALTDPGYRPQGEAQYRRNIENYFASLTATPNDALSSALGAIVSDGDPRFTLQPKEAYLGLSFARLREDIGERLASGAIELALVGDFQAEPTIELVARTLGAIPPREPDFRAYGDNRERSFTADRSLRVLRHDGSADQALVRMTWPTTDDDDFDEVLRLEMLQRIMQLKLVEVLREELGQTYSPAVNASQSRVWPGYGSFTIAAAVDAAQVEEARQAMLAAVEKLTAAPADDDTLLRARRPLLEAYDNALKTNAGWMNLADDAQRDPARLARFVSGPERLRAITAGDIQSTAQRYLDPHVALEIHVLPRGGE
ncbi:MAG: M16 family metallopeptidase [Croceibacterium sp.]